MHAILHTLLIAHASIRKHRPPDDQFHQEASTVSLQAARPLCLATFQVHFSVVCRSRSLQFVSCNVRPNAGTAEAIICWVVLTGGRVVPAQGLRHLWWLLQLWTRCALFMMVNAISRQLPIPRAQGTGCAHDKLCKTEVLQGTAQQRVAAPSISTPALLMPAAVEPA